MISEESMEVSQNVTFAPSTTAVAGSNPLSSAKRKGKPTTFNATSVARTASAGIAAATEKAAEREERPRSTPVDGSSNVCVLTADIALLVVPGMLFLRGAYVVVLLRR